MMTNNSVSDQSDPEAAPSAYTEKQPSHRQLHYFRVGLCGCLFVLLLIILGIMLSNNVVVVLASESEEKVRRVPRTLAPTTSCQTYRFPGFENVGAVPSSYTIRFTLADLCLNYPALDCFSQGPYAYLSLFDNNLWYFEDQVTLRVKTLAKTNSMEMRLEVIHAHDELNRNRAFIYTVQFRLADYCFQNLQVRSLVLNPTDGSFCVQQELSNTTTSQWISQFLSEPTLFLKRVDKKWVFPTPPSSSLVTTTRTATTTTTQPMFLLSLPLLATEKLPAYLILPQAAAVSTSSASLANALNTEYALKKSAPSCFADTPELLSRALLTTRDEIVGSGDDCTFSCKNQLQWNDLIACVSTCLNEEVQRQLMLTNKRVEKVVGVPVGKKYGRGMRAVASRQVASLSAEDQQLLQCSVQRTGGVSVPKETLQPNQRALLVNLESYLNETKLMETHLRKVAPLWESLVHHQFALDPLRKEFESLAPLRVKFASVLDQLRTSANVGEANRVLLENLYSSFFLHVEPWLAAYTTFFSQVGKSFPSVDLDLFDDLSNMEQQRSALESFALPIFSAHVIGEPLSLASATLASRRATLLSKRPKQVFNLELVNQDVQFQQRELFSKFPQELEQVKSMLNLAPLLESLIEKQVKQILHVTQFNGQLSISPEVCASLETPCALETCTMVTSNFVQEFEPNPSDASPCNLSPVSTDCARRYEACSEMPTVFLPSLAVFSKSMSFLTQLSGHGLEPNSVMMDELSVLLNSVSPISDALPSVQLVKQNAALDQEALGSKMIKAYPGNWLPITCLGNKEETSLYCDDFAAITISLDLCQRTQTPSVPTSRSPNLSPPSPSRLPTTLFPTTGVPTSFPTFPTTAPSQSKSPSLLPTLSPSFTAPSKRPTFPAPSKSPTVSQPTYSPTTQPTLTPIASFTCTYPETGCGRVKSQSICDAFTGCEFDSNSQTCTTLSECSEFSCQVKMLTFVQAGRLLSGCRFGNAVLCDEQRLRMFSSLKLDTKCKQPFVRAQDGGAWMGKEQDTPLPNLGPVVFVSPTGRVNGALGTSADPMASVQQALLVPNVQRIVLKKGLHRLQDTIQVKSQHAGLVLEGEVGAKVSNFLSLSGRVTWETFSGNVIRCKLPQSIVDKTDALSQLFVSNEPGIRARYPNMADPLNFNYASKTTVSKYYPKRNLPPITKVISKRMDPNTYPEHTTFNPNSIAYNKFSFGFGGQCTHFDPPVSYFCDPNHMAQGGCEYHLPSGVLFKQDLFVPSGNLSHTPAYFHTMHLLGWGLWTFAVKQMTSKSMSFFEGGWQEARGDCEKGGGDWYIENMLSLLDSPGEYFLSREDGYLYYYPLNKEKNPLLNPLVQMELTSQLRVFVNVVGTHDVVIRGLTFLGAYPTHMDKHEAPSGGDWTLTRQAGVVVSDAHNIEISHCSFLWMGGNGVLLSGRVKNTMVKDNDFFALGSTAVLAVGDPGYYREDPWNILDFPQDITIQGNTMSHVGLVVKQSSGVFLAISKTVIVEQNVIHNSPRAGIVLNDGFGGGIQLRRNVIFETVLESTDHGPINTWDRQQYNEGPREPFIIEENLLLGTKLGAKGIDLDDGAFNFISRNNVIVWGYQKFKGAYIRASGNLILYPLEGSCAYFTPQTRSPANWVFEDNTCVTWRLPPYEYNIVQKEILKLCDASEFTSRRNTYFVGGSGTAPLFDACTPGKHYTFNQWKVKFNQDALSTLTTVLPPVSEIEQWVYNKLPWMTM